MYPNEPEDPTIPPLPPADDEYSPEYDEPIYAAEESEGPEPPLEDPDFDQGTWKAITGTLKGIMLDPVAFFKGMKEDRPIGVALAWGFTILCISGLMQLVVGLIFNQVIISQFLPFLQQLDPNLDAAEFNEIMKWSQTVGPIVQFIFVPFGAAIHFFLFVLIFYLFSQLWGSFDRRFSMFLRLCAYSMTPYLFGFGISILNLLCFFYSLVLLTIGLVHAGKSETGRAVGTVVTPLFLCCACAIFCVFLVVMAAFSGAWS